MRSIKVNILILVLLANTFTVYSQDTIAVKESEMIAKILNTDFRLKAAAILSQGKP
jgi:hypothetical protein